MEHYTLSIKVSLRLLSAGSFTLCLEILSHLRLGWPRHRGYREQTSDHKRGEVKDRGKLGGVDQEIDMPTYKINKLEGHVVQGIRSSFITVSGVYS